MAAGSPASLKPRKIGWISTELIYRKVKDAHLWVCKAVELSSAIHGFHPHGMLDNVSEISSFPSK